MASQEPGQRAELFLVLALSSNALVSRMMNHGDNYGEASSTAIKVVAASSPEEAVRLAWDEMAEKHAQYLARVAKIRAEITTLVGEGKDNEAARRWREALNFGGEIGPFPASIPEERSRWRAFKVEVEGYTIRLDPKKDF